jgi:hypothetical protein
MAEGVHAVIVAYAVAYAKVDLMLELDTETLRLRYEMALDARIADNVSYAPDDKPLITWQISNVAAF